MPSIVPQKMHAKAIKEIAIALMIYLPLQLFSYSNLRHVCRIVPEQPFFDHDAVFPMPHGAHIDGKFLARGLNELPVPDRHGLGKGSCHYSYYGSPFS